MQRSKISAQIKTHLTFPTTTGYTPLAGFGFFIQNDIRTLDQFGEWYYNPSTKMLSMFFGSQSPASSIVQASSVDALFTSTTGISNTVLYGLSFQGANAYGINLAKTTNFTIQNCDILNSGKIGVASTDDANFLMEFSNVNNSNNVGVSLYGNNGIIRYSTIKDTGIFPGMGGGADWHTIDQYTGISVRGNGYQVDTNSVLNSGYAGIDFMGSSVTIQNNIVDRFCSVVDDGAGIYTYNGGNTLTNDKRTNQKIKGNTVTNGVGASSGTDGKTNPPANGIYLDNGSTFVEVTGNTVSNVQNDGILIHDSNNITITNNDVSNANNNQIEISEDDENTLVRNIHMSYNHFTAKALNQHVLAWHTLNSDLNFFDTSSKNVFNYNTYSRPEGADFLKDWGSKVYNFTDWKYYSGQDSNSTAR